MKSDLKKIHILAENAASRLSEPMSIQLCHSVSQSFPIMLLVSAVGEEQLRVTARSKYPGMHLAVITCDRFCADFAQIKQA